MNYNNSVLSFSLGKVYKEYEMDKSQHRESVRRPSLSIRRQIVKEINESALYLYEYYTEKIDAPRYDLMDDIKIGKVLGWTTRKTKEYRLKLEDAGWIRFNKHTFQGIVTLLFVLGKDKVEEYDALYDDNELPSDIDI